MTQNEAQAISLEIIANAGDAFSNFYQAIHSAREGNFNEADRLVEEGKKALNEAHNAQTRMLTEEAQGKDVPVGIIVAHSQDHLMSAILFECVAKEFILLYREKFQTAENQVVSKEVTS
ncbi:PTS lactose/cellobiose transporter subunit IIA [uncultured Olegusella sp.]|uniref:PTS lactose/cellobiose transporter subunit IIA n=1 Tax=uncultured Olegusella sp. TaxID=1979846 RepID=UPI00262BCD40|nr:PTS lactose/cellobiose transporter subunit IIA [uncultured Olegusella sp.]